MEALHEAEIGFQKQAEAQQLLDVTNALDKRDELYQQRRLDMHLNPQKYANKTADQWISNFRSDSTADDQAILKDMPWGSRRHAELLFSRLQRHQFDQQFTDYRKLWTDQGRAQLLKNQDDLIAKIALAPNDEDRKHQEENLDALYKAAAASGLYSQTEVEQMRENKESRIETQEFERQLLDKHGGGPNQALDNLNAGMYPHVKDREALRANAMRAARLAEDQSNKNQRAHQDGMMRVAERLADHNQLEWSTVEDWATDNTLRPEQVDRLRSILHRGPAFGNAPAAAQKIMYDLGQKPLTLGSVNEAISQMSRLGQDAEVTQQLNTLRSKQRALQHTPGLASQLGAARREFLDSPYNDRQTVKKHFDNLPPGPIKNRLGEAINHLESQMDKKVPKDKAMKEAFDIIKPPRAAPTTTGPSTRDYINE